MPITHKAATEAVVAGEIAAAEAAGLVVIDLHDAYRNHGTRKLVLAERDEHHNVLPRSLIADRLHDAIRSSQPS